MASAASQTATAGNGLNKRKMVQIGTHSGTFHCDEALGCYMLKQTPKYRDAAIVRTRDPAVLNTLDVIIDVVRAHATIHIRIFAALDQLAKSKC